VTGGLRKWSQCDRQTQCGGILTSHSSVFYSFLFKVVDYYWGFRTYIRSYHYWWPHPATAPRTSPTTIQIHSRHEQKPQFCCTIHNGGLYSSLHAQRDIDLCDLATVMEWDEQHHVGIKKFASIQFHKVEVIGIVRGLPMKLKRATAW